MLATRFLENFNKASQTEHSGKPDLACGHSALIGGLCEMHLGRKAI